jgi:hypothetical protein
MRWPGCSRPPHGLDLARQTAVRARVAQNAGVPVTPVA